MKYFVFIILFSLFLSCDERNQKEDGSKKTDQLEDVDSSTDTENTKMPESRAESLGLIGEWTIPSTYGGGELRIEHHLGKYYKNEELSDGTVNILEMTLSEQEGLKIFKVKDSSSEDTWVITKEGNLEARSKDGLIYSSEPI